jgi:hypothetical protein
MVHGPEVDVHMMAAAPVIDGHTVVGDSQIWISTIGAGLQLRHCEWCLERGYGLEPAVQRPC